MTKRTTAALGSVGALLLLGCRREAADEPGPFRHEMVASGLLDVEVRTASGPVAGALVWVRDPAGGPPIWQGATTSDGHARGAVSFPTTLDRVSVVVVACATTTSGAAAAFDGAKLPAASPR